MSESNAARLGGGGDPPEKSIRNIQITPGRRPRIGAEDTRESGMPPVRRETSRYILWGGVVLALLVLGVIALIAFRPTKVTVLPRSHSVLLDETARFIAYPAGEAAAGILSYTVEVSTFEDSEIMPAQGIERVEDRASGTITVYNEYSSAPVKLLKNTRFETPQGLIFKVPAEVVVPGKKGAVAGQISVTVIADKAGEQYNVAPVEKFTLPGLRSTPSMYAKVYARSTSAMTGGFAGERPAASPAALEAAQTKIRNSLEGKARAAATENTDETTFAFFGLARITFENLPPTTEKDNKVRIRTRARMELPLFPADRFAYVIGESVSAEAESGAIVLVPGQGFSAQPVGTLGDNFATSPLNFTLRGTARLVWKIDAGELAKALAGRDEAAFQTIVEDFPGIEEAHARIEPFWKNTFPTDPSDIKVKVGEPRPDS